MASPSKAEIAHHLHRMIYVSGDKVLDDARACINRYEKHEGVINMRHLPRSTGVATSLMAAKKVNMHVTGIREEVFKKVVTSKGSGVTNSELIKALNHINPHSVQPRTNDLMRMGLIFRTNSMRTNSHGNNEFIYTATERGQKYYANNKI